MKPIIYLYDDIDGRFLGSRPAQVDPARPDQYLTEVLGGTLTAPQEKEGFISYWTGTVWELRESPEMKEGQEEAERLAEAEALEKARLRDPAARRVELANIRWQRQIAGITVDGIGLRTDRDSIVDLRMIAGRSAEKFPVPYKAVSGFVSLTTQAEAVRLADAQDAYVQACFSHEVGLAGLIDNLSNDPEALATLDLTQGWPS